MRRTLAACPAALAVLCACSAAAPTSADTANGSPSSPPLSASVIVFDGAGAGHREVYRVALDGSGLTQITNSSADDVEPSAAGGVVLFTSYRDGQAELYRVGMDGTGERRLTNSAANETMPSLSPDGRTVAYVSDAGGVPRVWIAATNLAGAAPLTPASFGFSGTIEASPAWPASSDRLAFVATVSRTGNAALFTAAPTAGSMPDGIGGPGSSAPQVEPAWSPDGARLAFVSTATAVSQIFVRDLQAGTDVQLTHGAAAVGQPAWLPDGRLVYTVFTGTLGALVWIDPAQPAVVHAIATAGLSAEHPAAVRP